MSFNHINIFFIILPYNNVIYVIFYYLNTFFQLFTYLHLFNPMSFHVAVIGFMRHPGSHPFESDMKGNLEGLYVQNEYNRSIWRTKQAWSKEHEAVLAASPCIAAGCSPVNKTNHIWVLKTIYCIHKDCVNNFLTYQYEQSPILYIKVLMTFRSCSDYATIATNSSI